MGHTPIPRGAACLQVLRLAAMVLRGSGRLAAITSMYEAAAAAAAAHGPGQAELAQVLLNDVFGAHVRCEGPKQGLRCAKDGERQVLESRRVRTVWCNTTGVVLGVVKRGSS